VNRLELRNEVRRRIAESSGVASYSSDTDINAYLNEGNRDMCLKGRVYERTLSTSILNGFAAYNLPLDFLFMRSIANPLGVSLDPIEPGGVGRVFIVPGKPTYYFASHYPLTLTTRVNDTIYSEGTLLIPSTPNGYMYEVMVTGMVGSVEPTWPTVNGQPLTDNNATLICRELSVTGYNFTLIDTPTTAGGGVGTYVIIYFALGSGLYDDTISPDFPEDKHHILVTFATFRHFVKMKDLVRAQAHYADYAAALGLQMPGQQQGGQQ